MKTELLAPARDLACGIAAVGAGADAVYIGADRFSARAAAGNSVDHIARLVDHAHTYWARVYAAINTLLHDDELKAAERLIRELHARGVDALIIQDMAILELDIPPMRLIASTQTAAVTLREIRFLEECGFSRVILPRELSLDEIRRIREGTTIELESFVHGALCFSVSGRCSLSYALGGRSGNRGECAQPCRQRYTIHDAKGQRLPAGKHPMSLKDLDLSDHLGDLIAAGISSFKIEGRLKDEVYVKNATAYFRRKLDELGVERTSSGTAEVPFEPDLRKTFNRGYTTYFFSGDQRDVFSWDTPKSVGERLGIVDAVGDRFVDIDTHKAIHNGDGICFFTKEGELVGMSVVRAEANRIHVQSTAHLLPGMEIFRNRDREFEKGLKKWTPHRTIAVDFVLDETEAGFRLSATDEDGAVAGAEIELEKQPARKPMGATLRAQLARLGETSFTCRTVTNRSSREWFLPVSAMNELRRAAVAALTAARNDARPRPAAAVRTPDARHPDRILTYLGNVLNRKAREFYMKHGVETIEPAAETGLDLRGRKVMTARACLRREMALCEGRGAQPQSLFARDERGRLLELRFDCAACVMELYGARLNSSV